MPNKKTNKKISSFDGLIYSTNPDQNLDFQEDSEVESIVPKNQDLRIQLDKKQRGGKAVTLVTGFIGPEEELKELGKKLKTKCGVGGSVKNGEILIQGDFITKIMTLLLSEGYRAKRIGG
ncbi:translation initiation factor [Pedobacter sp. SD-b]|uniref:Translation initiation factor n=1 Tax=Pedobacter segetis TaxID=2793069 RepID=A0ABS1BFC6_9SPHI|nr:translation initiation factor [Pedobacter segetis]MBK0381570.1 translation initiation factor [Pedobacter segetis]